MTITPAEMALQMAVSFFMENAGFAYDPKKETPEEGKARCARDLAVAEQMIQANSSYEFVWSVDPDSTSADFDFTIPEGKKGHRLWSCLLIQNDEDGEPEVTVAALGAIDLGPKDTPSKSNYRRVIEAELASEHIATLKREAETERRADAYRNAVVCTDALNVDADAKVSEGDDSGAWVQAWVWVSFADAGLEGETCSSE